MIPEFPKFKNIEFSDKEDVESFTHKLMPYSDFNFTSLWLWDIDHKMQVSQLNGNLVVLFYDYVSSNPFLSFIGDNKILETVLTLLKYSKKEFHVDYLKLIPEEIARNLPKYRFSVVSDKDSHDYIYHIPDLADMNIIQENSSGREIRQFIRIHPDYKVKETSIGDTKKEECEELFHRWAKNKKIDNCFEMNEYKAFQKLFEVKDDNIRMVSIYMNGVLVGFTVNESLPNGFVISHFAKYDVAFHRAIYDILNWEEAKILHEKGHKHFNWEQDLGIPGIRRSKEKYMPSFFLEKFIVKSISSYDIISKLKIWIKNRKHCFV